MFARRLALLAFAAALTQLNRIEAQGPQRTDVPVRTVMLFSSGVGYFEHAGTVRGDGVTELQFKTTQINDILKSLVLQDQDGGRVRTVTYPSQDPVERTLRSFQVDITANPGLAALLNQLRGARVTVHSHGERISGAILGVETRQKATGGGTPVETPVLNVIDGASIRAIELPGVTSLSLDDARLQDELTKALVALSQARDQDKKPVVINFAGNGERRVRIGYVVETPVWKTSYRLLLDDRTSRLQGWAIVENQTESDWNDVSLSLVSGRPISFMMDLYRPLYAPRPMVVQELFAGLRPQMYDGGISDSRERLEMSRAQGTGIGGGRGGAPLIEQSVIGATKTTTNEMRAALAPAPAPQALDAAASVRSAAQAASLGELFQYTVPNVTLARQKSAMIPIVTDSVTIERLSIYNAAVLTRHPLNGVRLVNTTGKHLLQGPVTVLDRNSYAGDARIDNVPPGQERLLSYGIDLDVIVDNVRNAQSDAIVAGKIAKGLLTIERKHVASLEYLVENKSDKDKVILIEHPIRRGWKLVDTQHPVETTESVYRFKGPAVASKVTTLTVREEIVQASTVALLTSDVAQLITYSRTGEIAPAVRNAIARAAQLKQELLDTERQIREHSEQIGAISAEQERIRENMKTVGPNSQYYQRLMTKLNEQESEIERLQTRRDALQTSRDAQRKALEDYVANLTVG